MQTTHNHSELLVQLADGISRLVSSEDWQHYLDYQSRFHHYSFQNALLIALQRHEASQVAGFNTWKKLGRRVRKGEKAIWIIAPMVYGHGQVQLGGSNAIDMVSRDTANDQPVIGAEHQSGSIRGFKYVAVFDISQTDGDAPPAVCTKISGADVTGCFAKLAAMVRSIGFGVEETSLPGGINGDCTYDLRLIRIEASNSPAQKVKTLAHELAHALLHEKEQNRQMAELEAESTAYVVCQVLGVDSSDYSFGYVATWAGNGDQAIAGIKTSGIRIQKTAAAILQFLETERDRVGQENAA
ncbi:MAG: ArdC-like ssDNA-binding domain-containing protein [Acidimicrobiales bacterium]